MAALIGLLAIHSRCQAIWTILTSLDVFWAKCNFLIPGKKVPHKFNSAEELDSRRHTLSREQKRTVELSWKVREHQVEDRDGKDGGGGS